MKTVTRIFRLTGGSDMATSFAIWGNITKSCSAFGLLTAMMMSAASVSAQSYIYNYTSTNPTSTSGSFTITGTEGAYSLSAFAGTVGGVAYNTSTVGIRQSSVSYSIYLGGLANGVDTSISRTNDFDQQGVFNPGIGGFSDVLVYTTAGSSGPSLVAIDVALATSASYTYNYSSAVDPSTSGSFTITGTGGAYSLSAFAGTVGGVSYDTSTVGIRQSSVSYSIYLGGLANGVDTSISRTNDFDQQGVFNPGILGFSDVLSYTTAGSSGPAWVPVNFTRVAVVPEPATWAMMVSGFGIIGGVMRRRKVAISFA